MKYWINTNETEITMISLEPYPQPGAKLIEPPWDFELSELYQWQIVGDELVRKPEYPGPISQLQTTDAKLTAASQMTQDALLELSDMYLAGGASDASSTD